MSSIYGGHVIFSFCRTVVRVLRMATAADCTNVLSGYFKKLAKTLLSETYLKQDERIKFNGWELYSTANISSLSQIRAKLQSIKVQQLQRPDEGGSGISINKMAAAM